MSSVVLNLNISNDMLAIARRIAEIERRPDFRSGKIVRNDTGHVFYQAEFHILKKVVNE